MKLLRLLRAAWEIQAICSDRGESGVLSLLDSVDEATRAKMLQLLDAVSQHGIPRNIEKARHLEGEIWELKPGPLRILFFMRPGRLIILTQGFRKKNKAATRAEIATATRLMKQYLEDEQHAQLEVRDP